MKLSLHARERTIERTRLHPDDVTMIIQEGAYVSLGMVDCYLHVCFYSLFDRCAKIAVLARTSSTQFTIVTILRKDMVTQDIQRVDKDIEERAKRAVLDLIARKQGKVPPPKEFPRAEVTEWKDEAATLTICVHHGGKKIYEKCHSEVRRGNVCNKTAILNFVREELRHACREHIKQRGGIFVGILVFVDGKRIIKMELKKQHVENLLAQKKPA